MRQGLLSFLMLFICAGLFAQSDVTFSVDMNDYTSSFETVYVAGDFNSWSADANPMTDEDGDGVWTAVIPLPDGSIQYKFQLDMWNAQENLQPGSSCTVTDGGFTNRTLDVEGPVEVGTVCYGACVACDEVETGENGDITFSVDMNEYTGSFGMVYISGTFNGWSGDANPLTDDDADGVWEVTLPLGGGAVEYKFQLDMWNAQEELEEGSDCTVTTDGFTNRIITVDGDATLETVCFGSCDACGGSTGEEGAITFSVDMNNYVGSFTTVFVAGTFNGWSADANPMTDDDADGVWEATIVLPNDSIEYKFQLDMWTDQEELEEGSDCTITTDGFTNRVIEADGDEVLPTVCFGSCEACGESADGMVSFAVDMSMYAGDFETVYISGSFNTWSDTANPMEDPDGDNIWTGTVMMPGGPNEYKFQLDAFSVQEMFDGQEPCTTAPGEFVNRIVGVDGDAAVDTVCWESCQPCGAAQPGMLTVFVNMTEYTGDFTTVYIAGTFNGWSADANPLTDEDGDGIWTGTVEMGAGPNEYKFQVDGWADQEMLTPGSSCTMTTDEFTNRVINIDGDTVADIVCWGSCADCGVQTEFPGDITFSVNMNEYQGAFTTVFVAGAFNSWSADANPMEDPDGDGIWTAVINMQPGPQEFKYQVDMWTAQEELTDGDACTVTTDDFTNRLIFVNGDAVLDVVCWESCMDCATATDDIVESDLLFTLQPTLAQNYTVVNFNRNLNAPAVVRVTDLAGKLIYQADADAQTEQQRINTAAWNAGMYFVSVTSENKTAVRRLLIQK